MHAVLIVWRERSLLDMMDGICNIPIFVNPGSQTLNMIVYSLPLGIKSLQAK